VSLEGHASEARKITSQAVVTTGGARLEDALFPAIVAAVAGGPEERHRVDGGTRDRETRQIQRRRKGDSAEEEGELRERGNWGGTTMDKPRGS
jgi:hypothetical protein